MRRLTLCLLALLMTGASAAGEAPPALPLLQLGPRDLLGLVLCALLGVRLVWHLR